MNNTKRELRNGRKKSIKLMKENPLFLTNVKIFWYYLINIGKNKQDSL
jgi:hypothetical protein